MKKRACIIANSSEFDGDVAHARGEKADIVIVTDGAVHRLPTSITPHIVCGDFDSYDSETARLMFPHAEFVHLSCQETNDLEKGVRLALERGASEIDIVCACGGLLDQTLTTLSVVERYHTQVPMCVFHQRIACRVFSSEGGKESEFSIQASAGGRISIVPRSKEAIVSISNVRWPLHKAVLTAGSRGVSNDALGGPVRVTIHQGMILFFSESG